MTTGKLENIPKKLIRNDNARKISEAEEEEKEVDEEKTNRKRRKKKISEKLEKESENSTPSSPGISMSGMFVSPFNKVLVGESRPESKLPGQVFDTRIGQHKNLIINNSISSQTQDAIRQGLSQDCQVTARVRKVANRRAGPDHMTQEPEGQPMGARSDVLGSREGQNILESTS